MQGTWNTDHACITADKTWHKNTLRKSKHVQVLSRIILDISESLTFVLYSSRHLRFSSIFVLYCVKYLFVIVFCLVLWYISGWITVWKNARFDVILTSVTVIKQIFIRKLACYESLVDIDVSKYWNILSLTRLKVLVVVTSSLTLTPSRQ